MARGDLPLGVPVGGPTTPEARRERFIRRGGIPTRPTPSPPSVSQWQQVGVSSSGTPIWERMVDGRVERIATTQQPSPEMSGVPVQAEETKPGIAPKPEELMTPKPSAKPTPAEEEVDQSLIPGLRESRPQDIRKRIEISRRPVISTVTEAPEPGKRDIIQKIQKKLSERSFRRERKLARGQISIREEAEFLGASTGAFATAVPLQVTEAVIKPRETFEGFKQIVKEPRGFLQAERFRTTEGLARGDPFTLANLVVAPVLITKAPGIIGKAQRGFAVRKAAKEFATTAQVRTKRAILPIPEKPSVTFTEKGVTQTLIPGEPAGFRVADVTRIEGGVRVGAQEFRIIGAGTKQTLIRGKRGVTAQQATVSVVDPGGAIVGGAGRVLKGITEVKGPRSISAAFGVETRQVIQAGRNLAEPQKFLEAERAIRQGFVGTAEIVEVTGKKTTRFGVVAKRFQRGRFVEPAIRTTGRDVLIREDVVGPFKVQRFGALTAGGAGSLGRQTLGEFEKAVKGPKKVFGKKMIVSKKGQLQLQPPSTITKPKIQPTSIKPLVPTPAGSLKQLGTQTAKGIAASQFQVSKLRFVGGGALGAASTSALARRQRGAAITRQEITPKISLVPKQIVRPATVQIPKIVTKQVPRQIPKPPPSPIPKLGKPSFVPADFPVIPAPGGGPVPVPPPPFIFPGFGGGRSRRKVKKGKVPKTKFAPSFVAAAFGIFKETKGGKLPTMKLTGFETRPVIVRRKTKKKVSTSKTRFRRSPILDQFTKDFMRGGKRGRRSRFPEL